MSKFTLADLIQQSEAYLYEPIVSATTLDKIKNFSRLIPPTSAVGFEWRLAQEKTEVDYFIRADKEDGGDAIYAACNPQKSPDTNLYQNVAWQRIKQFCHLWLQPDFPLKKYVETIWLEMDNQELDKDQPVPCFFLEISRDGIKNPEWITEVALVTLLGQAIEPKTKNTLQNCIDNLPKFAQIAYLGTMLSRPNSPIRLCIKMEISDVVTYLKSIGWERDFSQVEKVLNNLVKDFAETVVLTLDLQDGVMPRIGFEYKPAFRNKGWDVILARLVENELCFTSEKDTLLNWQGEPEILKDRDFCRQVTLMPPDKLEDDNLPLIIRKLNHVKVDCYPDASLKAKMYYGLIYAYRDIN